MTAVQLTQRKRVQVLWMAWSIAAALMITAAMLGGRQVIDYFKRARIAKAVEHAAEHQSQASSNASTPKSTAAYSEGLAAGKARTAELRAGNHSVETWVDLLTSMHRQALEVPPVRLKADPNMEKFRRSAQSLSESIAKSETDPTIEQKVLEFLLLDTGTPTVIKEEAVFRQQHTQVLSSFLQCWELAAKSSADNEQLIAKAAAWFFANNSNRLSIDDNEREALVRLAHTDRTSSSVASP